MGFLILLVLATAVAGWFYRDYRLFSDSPLAPLPEATTMDVPAGTHLPGVLHLVEQRGIRIGNSMYWRLLARELGVAGKLHAGEYALTPGLTPAELLRKMAAGDVVSTILPSWKDGHLNNCAWRWPVTPAAAGSGGGRRQGDHGAARRAGCAGRRLVPAGDIQLRQGYERSRRPASSERCDAQAARHALGRASV
jgi:hypothetical protein